MENNSLLIIAVIFVLVLVIIIFIYLIINKIKRAYEGSALGKIIDAAKNSKQLELQEYSRPKDVVGMTKLVEPRIIEDFNNFNKDLLYTKAEENLRKIFNCYENKEIDSIVDDPDFVLIKKDIEERINDLKSTDISVKYDMVKFHRHALKSYRKDSNVATIEVSSTLEYYYSETGNNKKVEEHLNEAIKQTRYTTTFVYAYNESQFLDKENVFGLNCPNCGAPLDKKDTKKCKYCGTYVEDINLRAWKMSAFKEDYK